MQYKINIASLKQEIPAIEENTEGCLKGGFLPISSDSSTQYYNYNCPSGDSSCSATAPSFFENVNCPISKEAKCFGSTSIGCGNLNCADGSCYGTTTASPTSNPTNTNANINNLILTLF